MSRPPILAVLAASLVGLATQALAQPAITPAAPRTFTAPVTFQNTAPINIYGTADQTRSVCFYSCTNWAEEIHTINAAVIGLYSHNNNQAKTPSLYLARSNGTQAAPTAVTYTGYELNPLGGVLVSGYDGSVYSNPGGGGGAGFICYTDENWSTSGHGSHCSMYATVVGHTAAQEFIAFGGKDPQGVGAGIKIIAYRPIAFYGLSTGAPMLQPYTSGPVGMNIMIADESGPGFASASFLQTGSSTPAGGAQRGDLVLGKESDGGAAPGASFCVLKAVAGTTAGTGKIIARCGTSTTPTVIADNIGSGF